MIVYMKLQCTTKQVQFDGDRSIQAYLRSSPDFAPKIAGTKECELQEVRKKRRSS